jgi:hypothetical protein
MKVYEEFCKVTKVGPDWCSHALNTAKKAGTGDLDDPLKSSTNGTIKFENYRKRKEIYEGACSVNDERFNRP